MRWSGALLLALGCISGAVARAELTPRGAEWSDLSRFVTLAEGASTGVRTGPLRLGDLPTKAGLALFDPRADLAASKIALFVQEGGRLLLAVESPAAAALLASFGVRLTPPPAKGRRFRGHNALMVVRPATRTSPLFHGVDVIVTNRPQASAHRDGIAAVAVFSDGSPFAYHLQFGAGQVVLLADASLFINSMLAAGDNARLAGSIVRWLGRDGQGPIWIGGRDVAAYGRYGQGAPVSWGERANVLLRRLGVNATPDRALVLLLLTLILAATLVFVMGAFPGGSRRGPVPWRSHHDAVVAIEGRAGQPGGPADPRPAPPEREERAQ